MANRRRPRLPRVASRKVQPVHAINYLRKAEQHQTLALQALADGRWDSAALLSVHAAISAGDSVCVSKFGLRSVSQTHADQVKLLRELFPDDEPTMQACKQLAALIDRKNVVEYEARLCSRDDAEIAAKQAERIVNWAREVLSE